MKGRTKSTLQRLGSSGDEPGETTTQPAPTWVRVGTIRLVRDTLGFVLIENSGKRPPSRATLSVVRRGDTIAELKVSPEAKTGFVVADIVSGMPKPGDVVMWARAGTPAGAPPTVPLPEPAAPSINDLPPMEPVADPRNLRPVPEIGGAGLGASVEDPESELESELRSVDPEL